MYTVKKDPINTVTMRSNFSTIVTWKLDTMNLCSDGDTYGTFIYFLEALEIQMYVRNKTQYFI